MTLDQQPAPAGRAESSDRRAPPRRRAARPRSLPKRPFGAAADIESGTGVDGATFLSAKIAIPRCEGVPRPRLIDIVRHGARRKLTVVSAPAGWGKTTLLSAWIADESMPVAWLQLDRDDASPTRFWRHVAVALNRAQPGIADDVLAVLQGVGHNVPAPQVALVHAVAALPGDLALVLDDYHLIANGAVHGQVAELLENLPPSFHLVLGTRSEVPLPLARLRSQGNLTELRAADLAFTAEEARAFFATMGDASLTEADVATLRQRTEGWVAGLHLAALALQRREDVADFIAGFSGNQRDIADYLGEEVLRCQPDDLVAFLLQTSILDRLSAPLCDAVIGRDGAQAWLERIERDNLFLIPLDDERTWYRFHRLFADVLRRRLLHDRPDLVPNLHRRAAAWFEREHAFVEAVHHSFAAADADAVATLIERHYDRLLWACGEVEGLLGWLRALPPELLRQRTRLGLAEAWALLVTGRDAEAQRVLAEVEQRIDAAPGNGSPRPDPGGPADRPWRGEVAAIRARLAALQGQPSAAIPYGRQAVALLPPGRGSLRADVALDLGFAHLALGELTSAVEAFEEAIASGRATGNLRATLYATRYLGVVRVLEGRLRAAEVIYEEAVAIVTAEHDPPPPALGAVLVGLAELRYERNDLTGARRYLTEAIALGQRGAEVKIIVTGSLALARVYQAEGDWPRAREAAGRAARLLPDPSIMAAWKRITLAQGDLAAVERWVANADLRPEGDPTVAREPEYVALVRVYLARRDVGAASSLVTKLRSAAEAGGRVGTLIEVLLLEAVARELQGERPEAIAALDQALFLAEPEGYARTFIDQGPPVAALLAAALRTRRPDNGASPVAPSRAYRRQLLRAMDETQPASADDGAQAEGQLSKPLTGREREVLRLLAAGRTNREIADELFVAVGTVKAHVHRIYGKLDARGRTEAAAIAKDLALLDNA